MLTLEEFDIRLDHHPYEFLERGPRPPAQLLAGLARVADQEIDFGGAEVERVDDHVFLKIQADVAEGRLAELPHAAGLARGNHVVVGTAPAAASTTWPARNRRQSPNRAWPPDCPAPGPFASRA